MSSIIAVIHSGSTLTCILILFLLSMRANSLSEYLFCFIFVGIPIQAVLIDDRFHILFNGINIEIE